MVRHVRRRDDRGQEQKIPEKEARILTGKRTDLPTRRPTARERGLVQFVRPR